MSMNALIFTGLNDITNLGYFHTHAGGSPVKIASALPTPGAYPVVACSFNPTNDHVALVFRYNSGTSTLAQLKVYETTTWTLVQDLSSSMSIRDADSSPTSLEPGYYLRYSPDGTKLALASLNNGGFTGVGLVVFTVSGWSVRTTPSGVAPGYDQVTLDWDPTSRYLALADGGGLYVYDYNPSTPTLVTSQSPFNAGRGVAWSPDGTRLAWGNSNTNPTSTTNGGCSIWNTSTWARVAQPTSYSTRTARFVSWQGNYVLFTGRTSPNTHFVYNTAGNMDPSTWTQTDFSQGPYVGALSRGDSNVVMGYQLSGTTTYAASPPTDSFGSHVTSTAYTFGQGHVIDVRSYAIPSATYTDDNSEGTTLTDTTTTLVSRDIVSGLSIAAPLVVEAGPILAEGTMLTSSVLGLIDTITYEIVRMTAQLDSQALQHLDLADIVRLSSVLTAAFTNLLAEGVTLTPSLSATFDGFEALVETALLSPVLGSVLQAQSVLVEAFTAAAISALFEDVNVTDTATMGAIDDLLLSANQIITDALTAAGVVDVHNSVFVALPETLTLDALPTTQAALQVLLSEVFHAGALVDIAGDVYRVLAVNTATGAATRYTNYPFGSMARVGGNYVGAADDGLYLLDGDTDDGEVIFGGFRTGLLDFGIPEQKRVLNAYAGLTRSGKLVMKVTTTDRQNDDGERKERWYALKQPTAGGSVLGGRVELGRGIKSRYWQFELINPEGDDFEVDVIDLDFIRLTRRG